MRTRERRPRRRPRPPSSDKGGFEIDAYQTSLNLPALVVLVALAAAVVSLPRRYAMVPLFALTCLIPFQERLVIAGLDFNCTRLFVIAGAVRLVVRDELARPRWTPLDYAFLAWMIPAAVIPILRTGSGGEVVYQLGRVFDACGIYFFARLMIRSWEDLARTAQGVIGLSVLTAVLFLGEVSTGLNLYSVFRADEGYTGHTAFWGNRLRLHGPFVHPLQAGCFWVVLAPLVVARWWHPRTNRLAIVASVLSTLVVVYLSASSTPLLALVITAAAACLYPLRFELRWLRWAVVIGLVCLHLVMKAPVWHLISRVGFGSSTGYHRYKLIDSFINRVDEWWLVGVRSTAHWGHGLTDVTNEYVATGVRGGFLTFALLLFMLYVAYRQLGRILRSPSVRRNRSRNAYAWGLGLTLFAHSVVMMSISYWAQILVPWYFTLAAVSSLTPRRGSARAPAAVAEPPARPEAPRVGLPSREQDPLFARTRSLIREREESGGST